MGAIDSRYSIIVPVRNGSTRIPDLIRALTAPTGVSAELILVDDGSTDDSWKTISHFAESEVDADLNIRGLRLDKGRGQQAAIMAALTASKTRKVVTMDDDLSHPPAALPELISALDKGFDLVYATPPKRPGSLIRRLVSRFHQYHMSVITGSSMLVRVGSYRSLSSDLIDRILGEPFTFPYISAQCLVLRPAPRVCMLETSEWRRGSRGRFSFLSLLKLEIRLARHYSLLGNSARKRNIPGRSAGDVAKKWITEVCGG